MDIAVIGSNMVDLITYTNQMPKEGETLEAPAFKIGCGGKGANQAVAAAKLNSKVLMLTKVGDDIFADNTIRNLESWGINTTYVEKVPCTSSGVAPIFVNANSSNSILIIKGANKFLPGRYRSSCRRSEKMQIDRFTTGSSTGNSLPRD